MTTFGKARKINGPLSRFHSLEGTHMGPYCLEELIDTTRDKTGALFRAHDTRLKRDVALKLMTPDADPGVRTRFIREGELLARIDNPNEKRPSSLVEVYAAGEDVATRYAFISMGWIEGKNLAQFTRRLQPREVYTLMIDCAYALSFCHGKNVHHGDLKPANIIMGIDNHFKVIDFGLGERGSLAGDLRALGKVAKEMAGTINQAFPSRLVDIIQKSAQGNYNESESLISDLEMYRGGISRRKALFAGVGAALFAGSTYGIIRSYVHSLSAQRYGEELIEMNTDDPSFDSCFDKMRSRLYLQKVKPIAQVIPAGTFPFATTDKGDWIKSKDILFSNGFWPGLLWEGYNLTQDEVLRALAEKSTQSISLSSVDAEKTTATRFFHSHARAYELTGDKRYRVQALEALSILSNRFDPRLGFIAPNENPLVSEAGTLSDIVPFLLWSKDPTHLQMAARHVQTHIRDHLRENGAIRKTVIRDPSSLTPIHELNNSSLDYKNTTFARAQAQALVGLAAYLSIDPNSSILNSAEKIATYFVECITPTGFIPHSDLDSPSSAYATDTSAATIALRPLRTLHALTGNRYYLDAHRNITHALVKGNYVNYEIPPEGLITGACHNPRKDQFSNSSLIYGDHAFMKA